MMLYTEWRMALAGMGVTFLGFVLNAVIMVFSQRFFIRRQSYLGSLSKNRYPGKGSSISITRDPPPLPSLIAVTSDCLMRLGAPISSPS